MRITKRKATGAHFTPPGLARLVCERLVDLMRGLSGPLRVLDPACGDGNLLCAMTEVLPDDLKRRVTLIGIESDDDSFLALNSRQSRFGTCRTDLIKGDFLEFFDDGGLFGPGQKIEPVDVIIANPPYVRTQVLGANRAQELAARFGLSGRVDLYQAFLVAMAKQLRPGGVLGVITSNRFLTTKGGTATRRFLRTNFDLVELVDLGDTKLFEAAVLPALIFARKRSRKEAATQPSEPDFIRIYESGNRKDAGTQAVPSILDCLRTPRSGRYSANGAAYRVAAGRLLIPQDDARPWTMLTDGELELIARIDAASACRIADVAKVRVGIKTTADSVFIRRDWQLLPAKTRPEAKHLRPLLSQEDAARWLPLEPDGPPKQVLFTHEIADGRRRAIRFDPSSPTWKYLLEHRERLESRKYVIEAGRAWYEIWVPQDPSAWALPKIVFPDISADARFFLDRKGCIVDGNCYWITTNESADEDLLLLILGVANSSLMTRYHDLAFQNKLYAQRRRHLTQYIAEYPLPDPACAVSKEIVAAVRQLVNAPPLGDVERLLTLSVDRLVAKAFGFETADITGKED